MNKIKNKQRFALGLITSVLSITCFIIAFFDADKTRYIISAILLLIFSIVNYYYSFHQIDLIGEITEAIDEKDRYIAMKSCQALVQFLNYALLGATLLSLVLYGAFNFSAFLVVAITLCSVLILMFIMTLVINIMFEKKFETEKLPHP